MANRPHNGEPSAGLAREQVVEELLGQYIDRMNAGEILDRRVISGEHPEFAEELLERLEVFLSVGGSDDNSPLGTLGDYTLRRQIGRGGMGVVYEAWQGSMDRVVALKVLPPAVAADDKAFTRFMREAKTAGKLDHQNIVSVHAAGFDENTPYYAMELVDGETLAQTLARINDAEPEAETPFGKRDCAGYFEQLARAFADVADGLQHAHSKGVTHRDIKPSNLILDGQGRLRILDFGLARLEGQESLTLPGDFVGTPLYMSPEQARRKKIPVDHRTDVYSLGATMYETICGRPPFRGKDHADTLSQIIERDPVDPRKVNPRVPRDLETIVLKCLRKDTRDRYGTAEALGQDLRRFVRGDPIEAKPQTVLDRLARRALRYRVLIASASVFLILAIVGTWVAMTLVWKELQLHAELRNLMILRDSAETLWPCVPENVEAMQAWIDSAEALTVGLPEHAATLLALREKALPYDDAMRTHDRATHPKAEELRRLDEERKDFLRDAASLEDAEPGGRATVISFGRDPRRKRISYYFRHPFEVEADGKLKRCELRLEVDDGAIVYLNGSEICRFNMPNGPVDDSTVASNYIEELTEFACELAGRDLRQGRNLLAVEVHQANVISSDLFLDVELLANDEVLVSKSSEWRFWGGEGEVDLNWKKLEYEDSKWPRGPAPLGYGFENGRGRAIELREKARYLDAAIVKVHEEIGTRRTWRFADRSLQLKHDTLAEFVAGLESLRAPDTGLLAVMRRRLHFARTVYKRSVEDHRNIWDRAIASIRNKEECPWYKGLDLAPQVGLVPIGPDPDSGLWEFAHLQTGRIPERDEKGKLLITMETGLVFVLIPSGTFSMGAVKPAKSTPKLAANEDWLAQKDEGPVHQVSLDAFFISKYEMTQGQWSAFTGENPSLKSWRFHTGPHGEPHFLMHPVERVTWEECDTVLRRLALLLPTEAQWEYAARAETTTVAWTGDERESVSGAANLADLACQRGGGRPGWRYEEWLDDGRVYHAPVGIYAANGFGLHDTMGNVSEWCRDQQNSYDNPVTPGDGERKAPDHGTHRVHRGGSWRHTTMRARSADRHSDLPAFEASWLGVRPARSIVK